MIRSCIANGWINKDPFAQYKIKIKEVERQYLSKEELELLISKDFSISRLDVARDIFVFCCFTGLSFIDVKNLKRPMVSIGIEGQKWIFTSRQKTDTATRIPLLQVSLSIIDKYCDHPECVIKNTVLPVSSNQKMNAYLKEIADICGIQKHMTCHMARHTFATTVTLNNGVPIESVSKMLGHKSLRTTQHYAKILDKKVSEDMNNLREKFRINDEQKKAKA